MFNKQKQSRQYETRKYKKIKRNKQKISKEYSQTYSPKKKIKDKFSFRQIRRNTQEELYQHSKKRSNENTFTINSMSKEAKKNLYTYKERKPQVEEVPHFSTHSNKLDAAGPDTPRSLELQKAQKLRKRQHIFYCISLLIGVLGLILSLFEMIISSSILFILLIIISIVGFMRTI